MNIPENLLYTKEHEWIRVEGDYAYVGLTEFAQEQLGDIVFFEVETEDEKLEMADTFGTVEAVKTVSDLFMPVSGTVEEFNSVLEDSPEIVNKDPYAEGWIVKISVDDKSQLDNLLKPDDYKKLIAS